MPKDFVTIQKMHGEAFVFVEVRRVAHPQSAEAIVAIAIVAKWCMDTPSSSGNLQRITVLIVILFSFHSPKFTTPGSRLRRLLTRFPCCSSSLKLPSTTDQSADDRNAAHQNRCNRRTDKRRGSSRENRKRRREMRTQLRENGGENKHVHEIHAI